MNKVPTFLKLALLLLKSAEAELGDRCLKVNDCGGYHGAVCFNKTCLCMWTIQEEVCQIVETYITETIVIGVVSGIIFLICVAVIAFLLYRNFRKKLFTVKKDEDFEIPEISSGATEYLPITKVLKIKQVDVRFLSNHVDEMLKDDGLKLRNEFLDLHELVTCSETTVAKLRQNLEKSRSSTIPYNFNRVKLDDNSGSHGGNYINASHVLENKYIITQFPQRRTMNDFWRMIWEQNVSNLIMIAPLNEMKKCHRYYSRQPGKICRYGGFNVTLLATFIFRDKMKIRSFALSQNKRRRKIAHFHIYALNHLSLAKDFIENIRCIRSNVNFQTKTGPAVVHSGSAVEWSGVFVLVDYLIQKIENAEEVLDIPAITLQLLDERKSLFTENHYGLVYNCIRKYLERHTRTKQNAVEEENTSSVDDYEDLP